MSPERFDPSVPPFRRDLTTVACYLLLAVLTVHLAMIGPLMPPLMASLGLGFAEASLHSGALAVGMALMGLLGERVPAHLGRGGAVKLSFAVMSAGVMLLCLAPHLAVSLSGAFLVGAGGCLSLMVAPATMADKHGAQVPSAFAEANVTAYAGILAAPAAVSITLALGNWRLAFLFALAACGGFLLTFRKADFGRPARAAAGTTGSGLGFAYWCFWGLLMTSVSAENIMLIWSASYYEKQMHLPRETALWASMAFPAGMIVARTAGIWIVRRYTARALSIPVLGLAGAGFALFHFGQGLAAVLAGMFVVGLGLGNIYPFGITLALAAARGSRDTAAARVTLASAVSMVTAPLLAGAVADRTDLATAFILVPVYLALAAGVTALGLARQRA